MTSHLRGSVFDLCKKLKSSNEFDQLRKTMESLFILKRSDRISPYLEKKHDIAHNGMQLNCEFNGILLAFEKGLSVFELKEPVNLTDEEYYQLSFGNHIITTFIDRCLKEIKSISPTVGKALNPYFSYVPIKPNDLSFNYDLKDLEPVICAFKQSNIYTEVIKANVLQVINTIPEKHFFILMDAMDRDIIKIPMDNVPSEIVSLKMRVQESKATHEIEKTDALAILSFKILALKEILKNACHLLYSAILGLDLLVFDEKCLIDIEKNASNFIYKHKTILIQGVPISPFKKVIGDIVLFTLNRDHVKVHEFGFIRSITSNFDQNDGATSKITFCVIDEDLNPIFLLTQ